MISFVVFIALQDLKFEIRHQIIGSVSIIGRRGRAAAAATFAGSVGIETRRQAQGWVRWWRWVAGIDRTRVPSQRTLSVFQSSIVSYIMASFIVGLDGLLKSLVVREHRYDARSMYRSSF